MKRLLALTWKEFLQLKRDRMTLRMIVMVPLIQTLIFGYAINLVLVCLARRGQLLHEAK